MRSKNQPSRDDLKEKLEIESSVDGYYAYHASCNLKKEGYNPKPSHLKPSHLFFVLCEECTEGLVSWVRRQ